MRPGQPRWQAGARVVVAGVRILAVRDRRRLGGHAGHGGEQALHVVVGGVDACAGANRAGHVAAVAPPDLVPVPVHLFAAEAEQPHQVGVGAEAAMPYADGLLGRQPYTGRSPPATTAAGWRDARRPW